MMHPELKITSVAGRDYARDQLDLIDSVLKGYPPSIANSAGRMATASIRRTLKLMPNVEVCEAEGVRSTGDLYGAASQAIADLRAEVERNRAKAEKAVTSFHQWIDTEDEAITDLRAQLEVSQCRVELLEADMKSGDYETLYAQQAETIKEMRELLTQWVYGWDRISAFPVNRTRILLGAHEN